MTFEYFEQRFRDKAIQSGYSEDNIQKCLLYAKPILKNNLPVIFNTANFSALVGYKKNYIKKAVLYTNSFYRNFVIKKKDGKHRYLKEPLPSLKEIQYWILDNILYSIPVSRFAKAYIPERNLIDNAKYHKNKSTVLSLDIQNFFTSIKRSSIEQIFLSVGYSSNISNLLSKICCCDDCLPQGAPTSPYLSNIFMNEFDDVVSQYSKQQSLRYTRYADDLTFSGDFEPSLVRHFVQEQLQKMRLALNEKKIRVMKKNTRQIVTGIVVNDFIQVPKPMRNKIRQEVYFIKKFGLEKHLTTINNSRANYVAHLIGKINFVLSINSVDKEMKEYYDFLKSLVENTSASA